MVGPLGDRTTGPRDASHLPNGTGLPERDRHGGGHPIPLRQPNRELFEHGTDMADLERPHVLRCLRCGKKIKVSPKGRLPVYCSASCKQMHYAKRARAMKKQPPAPTDDGISPPPTVGCACRVRPCQRPDAATERREDQS